MQRLVQAQISFPCSPDTGAAVFYLRFVLFVVGAHMIGILHNLKRRNDLHTHVSVLAEHRQNMQDITDEVLQCQQLLENIFSPEALARAAARRHQLFS